MENLKPPHRIKFNEPTARFSSCRREQQWTDPSQVRQLYSTSVMDSVITWFKRISSAHRDLRGTFSSFRHVCVLCSDVTRSEEVAFTGRVSS